jgi:hypothetical protein
MSINIEPAFDVSVLVGEPIIVGEVAAGLRRVIPIIGGEFRGPKMSGKVMPGGADFQVIRHDGVTELVAQYTLQTDDGAVIYVVNRGYRHGPKEVMERLIRGEEVEEGSYYFRCTPTFETGSEQYAFLNRMIYIGTGVRKPSSVEIRIFEVQ